MKVSSAYNTTVCSNIPLTAQFGREPWVKASALFQFLESDGADVPFETFLRCNVTAGAGTAVVDGRTRSFRNFTYMTVGPETAYLHPLAAMMQDGMDSYPKA